MSKPRKCDFHLPPRVYRKPSGAYSYHPPEGGSIRIAGKHATAGEIEAAYKMAKDSRRTTSLQFAKELYEKTEAYQRLAEATKTDYQTCSVKPLEVFEKTDITRLKQQHIRQYMDRRGIKTKVRANRELAWLSNVFSALFERGLMPINPCKGVKKFREYSRDYYVEDKDYMEMLKISPPVIQVAMEIGYCTGLRITDIRELKWAQVKKGVEVKLSKTGVTLEKEISPRLHAALDAAKELPGISSMYVIHNRRGQKYTKGGFSTIWKRYGAKMSGDKFQFRDIRKKAITDYEGETKAFSGHKTDQSAAGYKIKPIKSPSH